MHLTERPYSAFLFGLVCYALSSKITRLQDNTSCLASLMEFCIWKTTSRLLYHFRPIIFAKAKTEKKTRRVEASVLKTILVVFALIPFKANLFVDMTFHDDLPRNALSLIVFRHRIVCSAPAANATKSESTPCHMTKFLL